MDEKLTLSHTVALIQNEVFRARNAVIENNIRYARDTGIEVLMDVVKVEVTLPLSFDVEERLVDQSGDSDPIDNPYVVKGKTDKKDQIADISARKVAGAQKGWVMTAKVINQTDSTNPDFDASKVGSIKITFNANKV